MNTKVQNFIKNTGLFLLGSFGSKILTFVLLPVYTSILSTSQYGQIDLVTTTQGLLFPIVTLSLSDAIFRFIMKGEIDNGKLLSDVALSISCTFLFTIIFARIINVQLRWEYMHWMLVLLASSIIYDILLNYLKAKQNTKKYVVIGLSFTLIHLISNIIFLVVLRLGIIGFFLASLCSYIFPSIYIVISEKIYSFIKLSFFDLTLEKRILRYSVPLIFTSLSWWIVTSSDKYMIRFYMSAGDVGVYSIASKIPLLLQTLISILQMVWQITTNQIKDEEPELLKENFVLFTRSFRQIGFISGSFLLILTQPLMMVIAKNDFYNGWIYAPFLIISVVFSFSTGMVSTLYGAYENNKGVLYSVFLGGAINILLNFFLIPSIGIMGATISTAFSRLVIAIYRLKDTEQFLQFDREYKSVIINCLLIICQCSFLVVLKDTFPVQFIFLGIIIYYNKAILIKGIFFIKSTLRNKLHE